MIVTFYSHKLFIKQRNTYLKLFRKCIEYFIEYKMENIYFTKLRNITSMAFLNV